MIKEKYRTNELCQYDYSEIWERSFNEKITDKPLRNDEIVDLLNQQTKLEKENKELKLQNGELLYQIGEVGKNNKTCRECECFIPEANICYMWDMEVEADGVVVACDQRKVKK